MEGTIRKSLIAIILLVLVLGGGFFIITGFGPGESHGWKRGFQGRGMPACLQKEIGGFILWKLDKGAKELDLSDVQQKSYDAFRSHMETVLSQAVDARMAVREQAKSQFDQEIMDLSLLAGTAKTQLDAVSGAVSQGLGLFSAFYNTLDDKQKKAVTARIKERHQCRFGYDKG